MEDSVRFMLFYASILLSCKDEELADFIDNTASVNYVGGIPIDLHECSIEELSGIREGFVRQVLSQAKDELDKLATVQPLRYKPVYDGQIDMWDEFYRINGMVRMEDAIVRLVKEGE
jgi:hypothetical protein